MSFFSYLSDRSVIAVTGEDRVRFLQGLVSNDVTAVQPGTAIWAALLTPQGRWKADFFIFSDPDAPRLLLDCATVQVETITTTLCRFRLRTDVAFETTSLAVHAAWGPEPSTHEGIMAPDPRHDAAGWRLLLSQPSPEAHTDMAEYDLHRLVLGLPDGPRDCEAEKTLLVEADFDLLNGVSWTKGCYMGQELTARTHYRGLVKKRLIPFASVLPVPAPGTVIEADGQEVGVIRSGRDHRGLALLRVNAVGQHLTAAGHHLLPRVPDWLSPALSADKAGDPS